MGFYRLPGEFATYDWTDNVTGEPVEIYLAIEVVRAPEPLPASSIPKATTGTTRPLRPRNPARAKMIATANAAKKAASAQPGSPAQRAARTENKQGTGSNRRRRRPSN